MVKSLKNNLLQVVFGRRRLHQQSGRRKAVFLFLMLVVISARRIVRPTQIVLVDRLMVSATFSASNLELRVFSTRGIEVRVEPMLRIQGYTDLSRVRKVIRETAQAMALMAQCCFQPDVRYLRIPVSDCRNGVLSLETGTVFNCEAFSKFLPSCHEVVVFVLTIGEQFDRELDDLQSEDKILEALFLENAGWLGVESVTRRFSQYLREQAGEHREKMTRRLSPGYSFKLESGISEWSLYEQTELFALFEGKSMPVTTLESGAMIPKMSRSGLYGIKKLVTR